MSAGSLPDGVPLHLHAEGPRGTGKTTLLRAVARRLPPIRRVRGCPFNCDPVRPHCPLHREMGSAALAALGSETVPAPVVELSASAKLATAVGSVDLAKLLDRERPEAALLPGAIARAHRGVLFVDEVNRLADTAPELTDALLDVMGTRPGRLQIEEAGLPTVVLEVSVTVWAASNPDEEPGPLAENRRQLADRFDLRVAVTPPQELDEVLAVLRARSAGTAAALGPPPVPRRAAAWTEAMQRGIADAFLRSGVGSLRALDAWCRAAEVLAGLEGAPAVSAVHVREAARLTLRGRVSGEALAALARWPFPAEATPEDRARADGLGGGPRGPAGESHPPADRPSAQAPLFAAADGQQADPAAPPEARPLAEVRPLVAPEWVGPGEGGRG